MDKSDADLLPPRYSFILNPYVHERLSRCPKCRRPTHARKFPLFIHIEEFGAIILGKTCRYCAQCELIIAHQHELESELAGALERLDPDHIGSPYLVVGTVEKSVWKKGLGRESNVDGGILTCTTPFKEQLNLEVSGGWRPSFESS